MMTQRTEAVRKVNSGETNVARHRRLRLLVLMWSLALVVVSGAHAIIAAAQSTKVATLVENDRARFDALRAEGFDALYNLDYEGARRRFRDLARSFPDHPAGPQFLAASLWVRTLNESRRLQASLYNTDSFYAKTEEKTDPKLVAEFRELTGQAKRLAEARLKRDSKDAEALYFLGAVEGLRAAFAAAVERSFISALRDGQNSVEHHREVLKLDPTFHDAEISIGTYDYVVATLPLPVKILAAVGGVRGSRKRGLETLGRVAREGKWAKDDAKVLLMGLFKREERYTDALHLARDLAAKYPRNYLFKLEAADALVAQAAVERPTAPTVAANAEREAFAIFDALLQPERTTKARGAANSTATPLRPLDLIHFTYGEALLTAGQTERAAREFLLAAAGAEPGLATMARLRAAQALDLAGQRREAIVHYTGVLTRPNVYDSHEEAKRGLRESYRKPATMTAPNQRNNVNNASEVGRGETRQ